jgi:hypothetical protein
MPQIVGELLNNLFLKAGLAPDNAGVKTLLSSPELANIQVPDEIVTALDNGLLSIEAAKNNHPDIKKKYFADAYDGIDKQLIKLVESDTFDEADIAEIKAEKSTSKKQELIISKLKAAKASAKGADKDEINRQLAAAHESARLSKLETETVRNEYEAKMKEKDKKAALKAVLATYKTIYDELPGNVKIPSMEAIINNALQDKNAVLSVDDNGNLILTGKDGSNVFGSNHVQLTPQSFLDQSFAPILKVSGPPKPAAPTVPTTQPIFKTDDKAAAEVSDIQAHNEKVLAQMSKPSLMS